ncbi:MAG TPA: nucleotidyl transferase AbiEii/AbiGii toxin family protein, partial [Gammaproteobacteria bacterium]|nr:nucleotidyl transferase AbiEii/AbiGii toxin family protein [Gammaproteobacteria bacterium]
QLDGKLDKKLYALKGGCNLRFFLKSIRYSEDIDFDVAIISKGTLEKNINKILESVSFKKILEAKGIQILQFSAAKQTDTTQRWKVVLQIKNLSLPVPTKIEFSRRNLDSGVVYSSIDPEVMNQYQLYPILCNHYDRDTAFLHKVNALINRTETQSRDIFDLQLLYVQGAKPSLKNFSSEEIAAAIKNVKGMHYEYFKGQVVAYLMEEYQTFYDSVEKWGEIKSTVIAALKECAHAVD